MDLFLRELSSMWPAGDQFARVGVRLVLAALLGAIAGLQREKAGKPAGLRTHMLVSLGAAVFVIVPLELGAPLGEVSRVIQGVAAGIGFIGAGAILKRTDEGEVQGLTTAAGIWLTAAVGVAVGLGGLAVAILAMGFAWIILSVLERIEGHLSGEPRRGPRAGDR
jgi:putative Mg2+ transporter-C (MgtC) family protein